MSRKIQRRIGKAQARDQLSTLIESVNTGAGAVEITDYGRGAAVLLSAKEYEWLLACARKSGAPRREARGLMVLVGDNALESATNILSNDIDTSLNKLVSDL